MAASSLCLKFEHTKVTKFNLQLQQTAVLQEEMNVLHFHVVFRLLSDQQDTTGETYRVWGDWIQTLISAGRIKLTRLRGFCFHHFSPSSSILYLFPLLSSTLFSFLVSTLSARPFSICHFSLFISLPLSVFILYFRAIIFTQPPLLCAFIISAFHMKKRCYIYCACVCRGVNLGSLTALTICFYDAIAGCSAVIELSSLGSVPESRRVFTCTARSNTSRQFFQNLIKIDWF